MSKDTDPKLIIANIMSENDLLLAVREEAAARRWLEYHTWNSQHSSKGFPDLCMVRGDRIIFAELKNMTRDVTDEQAEWIDTLRATGKAEAYVWRPIDWMNNTIRRILR